MDISKLFKMQDDVRAFVKGELGTHPNLQLGNALEVITAALQPLSKESSRTVVMEALKHIEGKADKTED